MWLKDDPGFNSLSASARFVYLVLLVHANQSGVAWPSHQTIAEWTGYTRRCVVKAMKELLRTGIVDQEKKSGLNSLYKIDLKDPEPVNVVHRGCEPGSQGMGTTFTGGVNDVHIEPIREPIREPINKPRQKQAPKTAETPLPYGPAFAAAWDDWLAYRAERKLPAYKSRGAAAQLKRLAQYAQESIAVAAINFSIAQGYQGIFPEKSQPGASNGVLRGPSRVTATADKLNRYDAIQRASREALAAGQAPTRSHKAAR